MLRKPSMGRQKIEIKRIENEDARQVCFSKRRAGLFKKASELCILCGAEIAIIVFSPAGKVFSFGHPGVDSLIERFIPHDKPPMALTNISDVAHRGSTVRELNRQCTELVSQVEDQKKKRETLDQVLKASRAQSWWDAPIEQLGLIELEQLRTSMEDLKMKVVKRADQLLVHSSSSTAGSFLAMNSVGAIDTFAEKTTDGQRTFPHGLGLGRGFF